MQTATCVHISSERGEQFASRLSRKGYERLGGGAFSAAYTRSNASKSVWKVCRHRYWKDGAWTYYQAILAGLLTGPAVPRVKRVVLFSDHTYAVLLEKLTPGMDYWGEDGLTSDDCDLVDNTYRIARAALYDRVGLRELLSRKYREENGQFQADAVRLAWKIARKIHGISADLHDGNYMLRMTDKGPVVVLTDPLAHPRSENVRYLRKTPHFRIGRKRAKTARAAA